MSHLKNALFVVVIVVLGAATVAFAGSGGGDRRAGHQHRSSGDRGVTWRHGPHKWHAFAVLRNASGTRVGLVWMRERRRHDDVMIRAQFRDLAPGFHGFHIHATGRCEPPGFTTAGGHLNPTGATHNAHAGDLPSLLVGADGRAMLVTITDRFSIADLRDADGSAVMVHSGPDNFANIPSRYGTPDQETLNTGDSGSRIACGVVR